MVERESIDGCANEWPAVFKGIGLSGEFRVARNLDTHSTGLRQTQHRHKGQLIETRLWRRPSNMINQNLDWNGFNPRCVHQNLIFLDLEIEKHVEIGKSPHQYVGAPVVSVAVKCRIDRRADNTLRLKSPQCRDVSVKINDCDALKAAITVLNGVEHAGIITAISRVRLHQERMTHAIALHNLTKLHGCTDFLSGRFVGDAFDVGEICRIDDMCVAIDLRFVKNIHDVFDYERTQPKARVQSSNSSSTENNLGINFCRKL